MLYSKHNIHLGQSMDVVKGGVKIFSWPGT